MNLYSQNSSIPSIPPFKPKDLFRKGEQGVWYDPSDMSTLYQDVSGSIPVTAVELPVGLMLDKSKGLVLGPELLKNGTFDTDVSGWTPVRDLVLDWVSGEARVTTSEIGRNFFTQNIPTVVGRLYKATATVRAGTYTGGIEFSVYGGAGRTGATNPTSNTTLVFYFTATSTTSSMQIVTSTGTTAGLTYFVDNISVCELPGNHAMQSTAAARPVLSARYNLLLNTETLSTQSVTTVATTYTLAFSGAGSITLSGTKTGTYNAGTHSLTGVTDGTLTLTVSGTVTKADLRAANDGINLPAYQRVTTATAYDTAGFPPYLKFDGVDDLLLTNSEFNLSGTNVASVFAGLSRLTNSGTSVVCELASFSESGSFLLATPTDAPAGVMNHSFVGRGSSGYSFTAYSTVAGAAYQKSVLTGISNIPAGINRVRSNGVWGVDSTEGNLGGGNFAKNILSIGARDGSPSSLYYQGRLYSLIIRGAQSTDAQIARTERWVNDKTKAWG